jgi:hypothetical protein
MYMVLRRNKTPKVVTEGAFPQFHLCAGKFMSRIYRRKTDTALNAVTDG